MKNDFGFVSIFTILAVVLAIGIGGYIYLSQNTQDAELENTNLDTADWKTFTSELEGYTIKYPSEWKLTVKKEFADHDFFRSEEVAIEGYNGFHMSLHTHNLPRDFGDSGDEDGEIVILDIVENENGFYGPIYLITLGVGNNTIIMDEASSIINFEDISKYNQSPWIEYDIFPLVKSKTGLLELSAYYRVEAKNPMCPNESCKWEVVEYSYDEFKNKPEVIIAKEIFKSLSYK